MNVEILKNGKTGAAPLAHEGPFVAVHAQVLVEKVLHLEVFAAVRAAELPPRRALLRRFRGVAPDGYGRRDVRLRRTRAMSFTLPAALCVVDVGARLDDVADFVFLQEIDVVEFQSAESTRTGAAFLRFHPSARIGFFLVVQKMVAKQVRRRSEPPVALRTRKRLWRDLYRISVGVHFAAVVVSRFRKKRPVNDALVFEKPRAQHVLLTDPAPTHQAQLVARLSRIEHVVLLHVVFYHVLLRRREVARVTREMTVWPLDVVRHPMPVQIGRFYTRLVAALAYVSSVVGFQMLLVLKFRIRRVFTTDADEGETFPV